MGRRHRLLCVLTDATVLRILVAAYLIWRGAPLLCRLARWLAG